jgi:hypothetical protein
MKRDECFKSFLKQEEFFEVAGAVLKIGSSLKPNQRYVFYPSYACQKQIDGVRYISRFFYVVVLRFIHIHLLNAEYREALLFV